MNIHYSIIGWYTFIMIFWTTIIISFWHFGGMFEPFVRPIYLDICSATLTFVALTSIFLLSFSPEMEKMSDVLLLSYAIENVTLLEVTRSRMDYSQ